MPIIPIQRFSSETLSALVDKEVKEYLNSLEGQDPVDLYRQVIDPVELPLLKLIIKHTDGNESRAANCLGVNRATLRSKLKRHGLL